jgi:hypothetical protein
VVADSNKCAVARGNLAREVSRLKVSPWAERAGGVIKAGYLASVKTLERNVVGNTASLGLEYLGTRSVAVALDYIQAVARSAATFGKVQPHEFRQIANIVNVRGMKAAAKGARQGAIDAVRLMRTGVDTSPIESQVKFELGADTQMKSSVMDRATRAVFNSMEAIDKPFYQAAYFTSLEGNARLLGIREGLTGKALKARTDELLAKPTEQMTIGAHYDAQIATFKNRTVLSDMATGLRSAAKRELRNSTGAARAAYGAANLAIDVTLPFTKVPSAIVMAGIRYSPAGFISPALKASGRGAAEVARLLGRNKLAMALVEASASNPAAQAEMAKQLSKATIGTGLTMIGFAMYANGTLTGSAPKEPSQRKLWDLSGKRPNSVLIGGEWRSITSLGPLAIPMLLGANIKRFSSQEEDKDYGDAAAFAVGSIAKTATEQSYLQGVDRTIAAMSDPEGKAAGAVAGMIPVPAAVNQVAAAVDPTMRESRTVREKVQAKIPFASKSLPARLDPFGIEIPKGKGGVRGAAESFLDITNPSPDRSTPLTDELERLQLGVSGVGPTFTVKGVKYQRTPEMIRELTKELGPDIQNRLEDLIVTSKYQAATDPEKETLLRKAMAQAKAPVYKRERNRQRSLADRIKEAAAGRDQL